VVTISDTLVNTHTETPFQQHYSGRSPGQTGGPASCGHSKLASARTGLPQTSVQFISVTEVVTKSVTKKRNEFFLRRPLKLKFGHVFVVGI